MFQMNDTNVAIEMKDMNVDSADQRTDSKDKMVHNRYERTLQDSLQESSSELWEKNKTQIKTVYGVVFILLYFAYFGYALYYRYVQFSFC